MPHQVLFYLVVVGSSVASAIIANYITAEWSYLLLLFPPFAYERAIGLIFTEGGGWQIAPGSELARCLWVNAANGTAMLLGGIVLHVVIPNEYGMTESQLLMQLCTKKEISSGNARSAINNAQQSSATLKEPIFSTEGRSEAAGGADDVEVSRAASGADLGQADPEVREEAERIMGGGAPTDATAIVINGLRLAYGGGLVRAASDACGPGERAKKLAVDELFLAIQHGECFGLLGPNGAGKTSTINIMSGLILQSAGAAHVGGFNTATQMHKV